MPMSPTMQEVYNLKLRVNEMEKKLSDFSDMLHRQSSDRIDETEDAICELSEALS